MTDIKQTARRYLLGELPEPEQRALEEAYFGDPQLLAAVAGEEHALIDEYVRGRLAPELRRRFESAYMSRPERRARVEFAEALLTRVDTASATERPRSSGANWLAAWLSPRPWLVAAAVAAAIVIGVATWIVLQSTRQGPGNQQAQTPDISPAAPSGTSATPAAPALSFVTLSLTVGAGQRTGGLGPLPTLEIPVGTEIVRLALVLRERDYGRYRVLVRVVGGEEILQRGDLRPTLEPSGPAFTIDTPAASFTSGDYMLTLQGATDTGEFDDLSQSLFRVVKR